mmetsp:Transcript_4364/g.13357  ORF Transcript_4364/g.13357 Transcript_4364/m.13357 type:complete len:503 (+) Transcript_4364:132-1640(+)
MTVVSGEGGGANALTGLVYFVKAFVGPGCLSLPLAFQNCGLALGCALLLATSAIVTFNLRTMVLCKQHLAYKGVRTYADLTREALGENARRVVELFINSVQLGICAVYFDFWAENVHALLPSRWRRHVSLHALIASVFPVYGALALLRSVDSIAPYAALANALIYCAIGIVLFSAVAALHQAYFGSGSDDDDESGDDESGGGFAMAKPGKMPLFYATVIYSFEGVCSLLPVENALARPREDMPTVMYAGMAVVTLTYASVGAVAYVAWPRVSSGSITAEMTRRTQKSGLGQRLAAQVANVSTIIAVILTFPVQLFPSIELLEKTAGFSDATRSNVGTTEYKRASTDAETGIELNPIRARADDSKESVVEDSAPAPAPAVVASPPATPLASPPPSPRSPASPGARPPETPAWKRSAFRIAVVVAIGLVAAVVPDLGALIDLIGALTGSALSLVVPAIIDIRCPRPGRRRWELIVDLLICAVGVVGAVAGTVQAVQAAFRVGIS